MNFATRIALSLLAAVAIPAGVATAADYEPPIVQEPEVPVEVGTGWYLRGDIGYVFDTSTDGFSYRTFDGASYGSGVFDGDLDDQATFGIGAGYHFTDLFRGDVTLDGMGNTFRGESFSLLPCTPVLIGTTCRSEDRAEVTAVSLMANGYFDFGTFSGFTPYVGGGLGYTYVSWDSLQSNYFCGGPNCGVALVGTSENGGVSDWRFTWQAMAGVAYAINNYLKLDIGYRYRQIEGGDMFAWDAGSAGLGAEGVQGFDGDTSQQEIRVGLRWDLW
jgi:opacity protein-like surface antigen